MRRFYHLSGSDPAAQDQWAGPANQFGTLEPVDGSGTIENIQGADAARGVYETEIEDDPPSCPLAGQVGISRYYERSITLGLTGPVGNAASRVTEAVVCTRRPVAELYEFKRSEVGSEDTRVRYNAVDTSLSANWWLIVTRTARSELLTIATGSNSREIRSQPWPSGPNRPLVGIYNNANGSVRRYPIESQGQWDTLEIEWYQHDQATGNATDASRTSLDGKRDDTDAALAAAGSDESDPAYIAAWDTLASHDAADPAWGYPPTVDSGLLNAAVII